MSLVLVVCWFVYILRNEMASALPKESEEFITCRRCHCEFNELVHRPKFLPCSHSVCLPCLEVNINMYIADTSGTIFDVWFYIIFMHHVGTMVKRFSHLPRVQSHNSQCSGFDLFSQQPFRSAHNQVSSEKGSSRGSSSNGASTSPQQSFNKVIFNCFYSCQQ